LGKPKTILIKIGSLDASTAIYMNTWQRIVESQKRNEIQESAINVIR